MSIGERRRDQGRRLYTACVRSGTPSEGMPRGDRHALWERGRKCESAAKSRWLPSELRRWLETVPTHEGKLSGRIRRLTRPQCLEILKVGVQGGGVQDQYSGRGGARVRKRVGEPFGHQHEPPRPAPH